MRGKAQLLMRKPPKHSCIIAVFPSLRAAVRVGPTESRSSQHSSHRDSNQTGRPTAPTLLNYRYHILLVKASQTCHTYTEKVVPSSGIVIHDV